MCVCRIYIKGYLLTYLLNKCRVKIILPCGIYVSDNNGKIENSVKNYWIPISGVNIKIVILRYMQDSPVIMYYT